jgi:hypothetical protein
MTPVTLDQQSTGQVIIPYGSGNHRYQVYPLAAVPSDWASASFDESTMSTGFAPFGSGVCELGGSQQTEWPDDTAILVRTSVALPPGATDVTVTLTAASGVLVDWNGEDISGGPQEDYSCPARDSFVFTVPQAAVQPQNLLAVQAYSITGDNGSHASLDIKVTASVDAATHPASVMFVHGINANGRDTMAPSLYTPIAAEVGVDRIAHFIYYQDKSYRPDPDKPACQGVDPPIYPPFTDGGIPVDFSSVSSEICDSQSDLGLNAVLLDAKIHEQYEAFGGPVVIVSNSMGVAVVRGMLSYSHDQGDGVAANEIDSVFLLEGAHDGSGPLVAANSNGGTGIEAGINQLAVSQVAHIDFSRPAQVGLTPQSDWYQWANSDADRLPTLPYFNLYGDISIATQTCFLIWCMDQTTIDDVGDVVFEPGTDDPLDTPASGGARFLDGPAGDQNWQWSMPDTILWNPEDTFMIGVMSGLTRAPAMHGNFLQQMDQIQVPDCQTGEQTTVAAEVLRLVRGRLIGQPYVCGSQQGG